jgi:hypothetical protein
MKIITAIFILISVAQIANADTEFERDLNNWLVVNPPSRDDWREYRHFFSQANHCDHSWVVKEDGGKVSVSLRDLSKSKPSTNRPPFEAIIHTHGSGGPAQTFSKVDDGWIATYNRGEFGAAVYWFNEDGTVDRKLSDHHIKRFFYDEDRIFAIEGIAHLSRSRGSIVEIVKKDGEWECETFIDLLNAPAAIAKTSSSDYVIATSDTLLRANLNRQVHVLIQKGDWGSLYPTSVAVGNDGYVYIGMKQYVVRCKLGTSLQKYEFLVPDEIWINKEKLDRTRS